MSPVIGSSVVSLLVVVVVVLVICFCFFCQTVTEKPVFILF